MPNRGSLHFMIVITFPPLHVIHKLHLRWNVMYSFTTGKIIIANNQFWVLDNFNFLPLRIIIRQSITDMQAASVNGWSVPHAPAILAALWPPENADYLIAVLRGIAPRRVASRRVTSQVPSSSTSSSSAWTSTPAKDRRANVCEREDRVRGIRQGYVSKHIQLAPLGAIAGAL